MKKWVKVSGIAMVSILATVLTPIAATAGTPVNRAFATTESNCGEPLTVYHPASVGQSLTAAELGRPANPVLAMAAQDHATWLTHLTCQSVTSQEDPENTAPADDQIDAASTSSNWSGYVASTSFIPNYVQGDWTEPSVSLASGTTSDLSSIWPGIGGDCSTCQLIQAGTDQYVTPSGQSHWFWFEVWPNEVSQEVDNMPVSPGNKIAADVSYSDGTAWFDVLNQTTGVAFSTSQATSAPTKTAEWIVERPTLTTTDSLADLPNFGSVTYTSAEFEMEGKDILGYTAKSGSAGVVNMTNNAGAVITSVGKLSSSGDSFKDTYAG